MTWRRWLPLSGIVFVALAVLTILVSGSTPGTDDPASKVLSFYNDHQNRQILASFIFAAAVPFVVIFACVAAQRWGGVGGGPRVWPLVLVGGSVLLGATILAAATIHFALADGADNDVAAAGLQMLNVIDNDFWVGTNAALGVMMLGAAGTLLLVPLRGARWLGWIALMLGIALYIPFADFFALLASLLWILVASVVLFRGTERAPTAEPTVE